MKLILQAASIVMLVVTTTTPTYAKYLPQKKSAARDTQGVQAKVDSLCRQFVENKKAPGLAVGVIQNGVTYIACFGKADEEKNVSVKPQTVFEIGSITKVFTAELGQILADKGQLDWNAHLKESLPAAYAPETDDGTTLLHLVTHTSGYPRLPLQLLLYIKDGCNPYTEMPEKDYHDYIIHAPGKKAPDTSRSEYSNMGFSVLANVLEYKSRKPYAQLLQDEILQKLGMAHTALVTKDTTLLATGYDEKGNKTCHWDFPIMYGAGAIRSDITDMMKFAQANLVSNSSLYPSFAATQKPIYKTTIGMIGKGWQIDTTTGARYDLGNLVWHNGGTGGFRTFIGLLPDMNAAVVVLCNQVSDEVDNLGMRILVAAGKASQAK